MTNEQLLIENASLKESLRTTHMDLATAQGQLARALETPSLGDKVSSLFAYLSNNKTAIVAFLLMLVAGYREVFPATDKAVVQEVTQQQINAKMPDPIRRVDVEKMVDRAVDAKIPPKRLKEDPPPAPPLKDEIDVSFTEDAPVRAALIKLRQTMKGRSSNDPKNFYWFDPQFGAIADALDALADVRADPPDYTPQLEAIVKKLAEILAKLDGKTPPVPPVPPVPPAPPIDPSAAIAKLQADLLLLKAENVLLEARVKALESAKPPPVPPVPPVPPTPDPAPIPVAGFRVIIIEDKEKLSLMPEAQLSIRTSPTFRDYLDANCITEADGKTKSYRIWDHKTKSTDAANKVWQDALARPRASLPWIIISNPPHGGYEGPLPKNETETIQLLKKIKGK